MTIENNEHLWGTEKAKEVSLRPLLVLHIGGPKTGSSALQKFLTDNPILVNRSGRVIEYWKLSASQEEGKAFDFDEVSGLQPTSAYPYYNSHALNGANKKNCVHAIFNTFVLEHASVSNKIFVFSSEEWAIDFNNLDVKECECIDVGFDSLVLLNVRPQVDMIISAYLQWDLWQGDGNIEQTRETLSTSSNWARQLQNTRKFGIDNVCVVYSKELIGRFCNLFDIDSEKFKSLQQRKLNKTLPLEAITLIHENRELLRSHGTADIDFLVEDILDNHSVDTQNFKLLLPPMIVNSVHEYFLESNIELMGYLEKTDAERYLTDTASALMDLIDMNGRVALEAIDIPKIFLEKLAVGALNEALKARRQLDAVRRQLDAVRRLKERSL